MTNIFALFPGQGSQSVGMGKDLAAQNPLARELFERADAALDLPLSQICFEGPAEKLTLTEIAQPAILTVSTIAYTVWRTSSPPPPERVVVAAGHSLGEYSALVAAEALSFEDAVRLVHRRGRYMQEAVPVGSGKMVAVLGKEVSEIEDALSRVTDGVAEIANINAPGQIVVAGSVDGIQQFQAVLTGARVVELQVSAPFHCSLMRPAEERLRHDLAETAIRPPTFPVYQNFTAASSTDPATIRENLARQVCGRVRWVECVKNALTSCTPQASREFGAGTVLTGLMKRIEPGVTRL